METDPGTHTHTYQEEGDGDTVLENGLRYFMWDPASDDDLFSLPMRLSGA